MVELKAHITWCSLFYCRSYRSIGDEAFMTAFETATLDYEEWTHEVKSQNCILTFRPLPEKKDANLSAASALGASSFSLVSR